MKRMNKTSFIALAFLLTLMGVATSCADKDVYDPNAGKGKLPAPEEYFGFETRTDINLNVDYEAPGFKAIIEVYDQYPLQEGSSLKKVGLIPVYSAYTTENAKFNGKMKSIPTTISEAYLYTDCWGLPQCVQLKPTADGFEYIASKATLAQTRSGYTDYFQGEAPYDLRKGPDPSWAREDNVYSIAKWGVNGVLENGFLSKTTTIGGVKLSEINSRVQKVFDSNIGNNKKFLSTPGVTNIVIPAGGAQLDVVFLSERAMFRNTLGYYYYNKAQAPYDNSDIKSLKKFIIFPNCSLENGVLLSGATARLKYYGPDGNGAAQDRFPEDYVVGWFFISNGFTVDGSSYGPNTIVESSLSNYYVGTMFTSNEPNLYNREDRRFVVLEDATSKILVYGFEDQVKVNEATEDYSDVLFSVISDADITTGDRPEIPDEKPDEKPGKDIVEGTLAFEDIWPNGGDYDLNDVIVEYSRAISFNGQNKATEVTETFAYVHKVGSAAFENIFAYQVDEVGDITSKSDGVIEESPTKSIVINKIAKNNIGQSYTIVRDLKGQVDKDAVRENFNPYIIVGGYKESKRTEVHLPKHAPTSAADLGKIGSADDAYYIDKDGSFPFAIDIPIKNFKAADERKNITLDSEYPSFAKWANSKGAQEKDWYLKDKGAK